MGKLQNLEMLLNNLSNVSNNTELEFINKNSNIEGLSDLINNFNNSKISSELKIDYSSSYDTRQHKWGAFPNTLHSKIKIQLNKYKISSFELFTNISTKKYSDILKQSLVVWTSSNDINTINSIIEKFNNVGVPTEVIPEEGVIKYDMTSYEFFKNIN